jgi:hypothetical protein
MSLCRGHDKLMSWTIVEQDIEHAIKWRFSYVPQEILIEHANIQGWPRKRSEIGLYIGQHMKHKECATWDQSILWYGYIW